MRWHEAGAWERDDETMRTETFARDQFFTCVL